MKPEYKFTLDNKITSCKECPLVDFDEVIEHTRTGEISHKFITCKLSNIGVYSAYESNDIAKSCKLNLIEHKNY